MRHGKISAVVAAPREAKPTERDLVALMLGAAVERRSEAGVAADRGHR